MGDIAKGYYKTSSKKENKEKVKASFNSMLEGDQSKEMLNLLLYQGVKNPYQLGLNPRDVEDMMENDPAEILARAAMYKAAQVAEKLIKDDDYSDRAYDTAEASLQMFNEDLQSYDEDPQRFKDAAFGIQRYDNERGSALTSMRITTGDEEYEPAWQSFETDLDYSMRGSFDLGDAMWNNAVDFSDILSVHRWVSNDKLGALKGNVERQLAQQDMGIGGNILAIGAGVVDGRYSKRLL